MCVFVGEAARSQCLRVLHSVCSAAPGRLEHHVDEGYHTGKPTNQGVNQLKYQRSLKSTAEERVGRRCANLRVLNSYWINQDSTYKYFEVILVDPQHKAIRRDPRINWIVKPVHKVYELRSRCSFLSLIQSSIVSLVVLQLPGRSRGVSGKAISSIIQQLDVVRHGSDITRSVCGGQTARGIT